MTKVVAVVVAAGESRRMGPAGDKQFAPVAGRPLLAHTLAAFEGCEVVDEIVLVCAADKFDEVRALLAQSQFARVAHVVEGGASRQRSVANGLEQVDEDAIVAVHDGARPLVSSELIRTTVEALPGWDGVVPAMSVADTVKQVGANDTVVATLDRASIRLVQTPQVFPARTLKEAVAEANEDGIEATDDAALVERRGGRVRVIRGEETNIKITVPEDLTAAERLLSARSD